MVNQLRRFAGSRCLLGVAGVMGLAGVAHAGGFASVVIDPGHGGHDLGGHYGKVYEKHLALDTAMRLEHYLRSSGYRTVMTRRSDKFISLPRRISMGNSHGNAIFVSIHYNYSWKRHVSGFETFYHNSRSRPLAEYVHYAMLNRVRAADRGVKYARYYVLRNSRNPAVLVEGGFLSNSRERRRVMQGDFRDGVARGIAEGIARYQSARRMGRVH